MKKNIKSLSEALKVQDFLSNEKLELHNEIKNALSNVDINNADLTVYSNNPIKLLYYLSVEKAKLDCLDFIRRDLLGEDHDLDQSGKDKDDMKRHVFNLDGIIADVYRMKRLEEEFYQLQEYISNTFSDADFKRLRSEESIARLKKFGYTV